MLGLKLEESRIYQEAQAEGEHRTKLQMVPKLLQEGMSIERIASLVELPIEEVRQAIHPPQT
jgi:predicted transposase/invertase (TIGR01784 family)